MDIKQKNDIIMMMSFGVKFLGRSQQDATGDDGNLAALNNGRLRVILIPAEHPDELPAKNTIERPFPKPPKKK